MSDWPIVEQAGKSPQALADYIIGYGAEHKVQAFFAGPEINGRFFYSDDLRGFNFDRKELELGELLNVLLGGMEGESAPCIYAGAIPLRGKLKALLEKNVCPLLDPAIEKLESIWIGNRGRTATHWDLPQNLACVVGGRRRFTLFPPAQLPNLYVGPIDFTLAGQPVSLVDVLDPDLDKYPRFEIAMRSAQSADLGPGDVLYLPSMWFHHVESLDPLGVLINFWWRDAELYMFSPNFTLMHALLSIRDMPLAERKVWREVFDYYVFGYDDDSLQHIPENARGVLGKMSPNRVARLRTFLLKSLNGEPRRQ